MAYQNIYFLTKKYLNNLFCFRGFSIKSHFKLAFDDNVNVIQVFIFCKSSDCRLSALLPRFPHTVLCRGWVSSGSFQPGTVKQ
jgi:hypothetical protein